MLPMDKTNKEGSAIMGDSRVFRKATADDFDACMEVYHAVIDNQDAMPSSPKWVRGLYPTKDFLEEQLPDGVLIAEDDGRILASVVVNHTFAPGYEAVPWSVDVSNEEALAVHLLAVDPAHHKEGLGRFLMDNLAEWAREQGFKTIRLDVINHNPAACGFYEKLGYTYKGVYQLYYLDCGLTDFFMFELVL